MLHKKRECDYNKMTDLIGPLSKGFCVYIASCMILNRIRKKCPEYIIQPQVQPLDEKASDNAMQTAIINLCIGMVVLYVLSPYIRISDAGSNLLLVEMLKLAVMFFISDTMFYWSHRFMHIPRVFKLVHKKHHSHNEPVSWTSLYVHPLEFLIAVVGIFAIPLMLFKIRSWTATAFLCGVMLSLVLSHCGLNLGRLLDSTHHDLHHQKRKGNYGSNVGIWDWLCGTIIR